MSDNPAPTPTLRRPMLWVAAFSFALFLIVPLAGRILSGHESVQPETAREMYERGDWIVPRVGGDAWLERPPIPMWFICGVYAVAGNAASDTVARIAAILTAVPIVLLVAGIGARLYGRNAGILSGLIFATMQEFYAYASNPEADIFLALIVTGVLAMFVRLEFGPGADRAGESTGFFRGRPWRVAAFFALLGATNLAKGVIFGTAMAGIPIAGYLLWNRSWGAMRRYVWLWGFLIAAGVSAAWPLMVIGKYPEILELWKEHYGGRLNQGYLQEPWWYYIQYVPNVLIPWTIPAFVGLWLTRKAAFAGPGPERLLWCWAILPPVVFSLSDGKHHHYLLQCMAPWAVLSVIGLKRIWEFCRERFPGWSKEPLVAAAVWAVIAAAALTMFGHKVPGGLGVHIAMGAFVPFAAFVIARSLFHPNGRTAMAGMLLVTTMGYAGWSNYQAHYVDRYDDDLVFVHEGTRMIPADAPVHIQFDWIAPLETFWMLFHCPRQADNIRDPWQLAERSTGRDCAYIFTRKMDIERLSAVGTVETVLESRWSRVERRPEERRVLCKVTFLKEIPAPPEDYIRSVRRTLW